MAADACMDIEPEQEVGEPLTQSHAVTEQGKGSNH